MRSFLVVVASLFGSSSSPVRADVARPAAPPTHVLDFEVVHRGDKYVLRDDAFEIAFPMEPQVKTVDSPAADGTALISVTALAGNDDVFFGLSVTPVVRDKGYNAKKGIELVRDGALKAVGAKLVSETSIKVAGRDGRRVLATVAIGNKTGYIELREVWDSEHRSLVMLQTIDTTPTPTAATRAFLDSFAIANSGRGPLDPPPLAADVATPTGVLDLELVRHGDKYILRDDAIEIAFPLRPVVGVDTSVAPLVGFTTNNYAAEVESYGLFGLLVPEGNTFDVDKGLAGARDGMLKLLDKPHSKEIKAKIAGLDGRRVQASGTFGDLPVHLEAVFVWDAKHRMVVGAVAMTRSSTTSRAGRAYLDSLAIHGDAKPPHDPASK